MEIADIFENFPKLETRQLILRKLTLDDGQEIFEYASDPEVAENLPWERHKSVEDSINFLKLAIQNYEEKKVADWGIVNKKDNKLIGTIGYMWLLPEHNRAEIGYALSNKYWGKGLMTEAVSEIIRFGFEQMKLNRIEARCFMKNIASEKVLYKVGMTYEGIARESLFGKGIYYDLKVYSILRREYYTKKKAYKKGF